ncbi:hypothetical protein [Bordetella genomosp. 13]|uniref:hypothetical protein n=1 Tax=Bordetella genomosp. 13 TaxID=463040 RepID=UPI00119E6E67|nr:hypothetical protein [Bordetella genomosp. 13]
MTSPGCSNGEPRRARHEAAPVKRLLAVLALLAGGFSAELAHPTQCNLLARDGHVRPERDGRRRRGD